MVVLEVMHRYHMGI